jgi:hypothetical protein
MRASTGARAHEKLLSWMRLTTPRSSRQGALPAIDAAILVPAPADKCTPPPQQIVAERFSALAHPGKFVF